MSERIAMGGLKFATDGPLPEGPMAELPKTSPSPTRPPSKSRGALLLKWAMPVLFLAVTAWSFLGTKQHPVPAIPYTDFYALVSDGKVAKVTLTGQDVAGTLKQDEKVGGLTLRAFETHLPQQDDRDLLPLLRQQKV